MMMFPRILGILAGGLVAIGFLTGNASAAIVDMTYSDRSAWLVDIGGSTDFSETFNSFTVDTEFVTTTLSFNGFSLKANEQVPTGGNKVDVGPFGPGISATSGVNTTPQANLQLGRFPTGQENTVTMTFNNPVNAWGADFEEFGISTVVELLFTDGTTQLLQIPESQSFGPEFLGFTSQTTQVASLTFMVGFLSGGNPIIGGFGGLMDNVAGNFAAAISVPEPQPLPLFAAGLALLALLAWRNKRAAVVAA